MKSTSSDVKKFWPARLVPVVLALVGAGLAGLAVSGPDGWAIMPADTYAQLLAGLGGMGCFVVLRRKRD
jgi:hypothetical protein